MSPLHLFEALGIEIEYMLVDRSTLDVLPRTDRLLEAVAGEIVSDVERGEIAWSNELVLHVVELKSNGPTPDLAATHSALRRELARIDELLAAMGGQLLPTAMHPWMDPDRETLLWPHESSPIYEAYDRIFSCRGHGWSNLQSVHLNLPFAGDEEFGRLHAATRIVLPLLPALAASSPVVGGRSTPFLDNRMEFYRQNSRRIPSLTGEVIPEPVFTRADYEREIFQRIYRDIAPHDPEGILQDEFLNSRGAIARFGRGSLEIRVIDSQECPAADCALSALVVETLRALVAERWSSFEEQCAVPTAPLAAVLRETIAEADAAPLPGSGLAELLGAPPGTATAGELWKRLAQAVLPIGSPWRERALRLVDAGPLARRILRATGPDPDRANLTAVYRRLGECLLADDLFEA